MTRITTSANERANENADLSTRDIDHSSRRGKVVAVCRLHKATKKYILRTEAVFWPKTYCPFSFIQEERGERERRLNRCSDRPIAADKEARAGHSKDGEPGHAAGGSGLPPSRAGSGRSSRDDGGGAGGLGRIAFLRSGRDRRPHPSHRRRRRHGRGRCGSGARPIRIRKDHAEREEPD